MQWKQCKIDVKKAKFDSYQWHCFRLLLLKSIQDQSVFWVLHSNTIFVIFLKKDGMAHDEGPPCHLGKSAIMFGLV